MTAKIIIQEFVKIFGMATILFLTVFSIAATVAFLKDCSESDCDWVWAKLLGFAAVIAGVTSLFWWGFT